jgi:four helix bundle protein
MTATDQQHEVLEGAVALFKDIYRETETWPRMQVFGLIMDLRRTAMGVSMNLTEGRNRAWGGESAEFVKISQENLAELRNHLLRAKENEALAAAGIEGLLQQVNHLDHSLQGIAASLA